jgi:hypothetical protein
LLEELSRINRDNGEAQAAEGKRLSHLIEGKIPPAHTGFEEEKVTRTGDLPILSPTKLSSESKFEYKSEPPG